MNGKLNVKWMTKKTAPDALLEFASCNCKRSKCTTLICPCMKSGFICTDVCGCGDKCENVTNEESDDDNQTCSSSDDDVDSSSEEEMSD